MSDSHEKKITFQGVATKYHMKKVVCHQSAEPKCRAGWTKIEEIDEIDTQRDFLFDLSKKEESNIYSKEITCKLNGYRNQDILKKRYDPESFITFMQTVNLLIDCKLVCFYCSRITPILYKNVRDGNQWSLDRINNDIGHSKDNVVVSCLKCNLQRKRMSSSTFAMSKQMVITRV